MSYRAADSHPASSTTGKTGSIFDYVLGIGIYGLLAFGPLAFGAVEPWSICILEVGVAVLLVIWFAKEFVCGGKFHIASNPLFAPMVLFASLVAVQVIFHRTAYWYATWEEALLLASYGGLFFLVSQIICQEKWITSFGFFCAGYGLLVSLFAIIQQFTGNGKIYWRVITHHGGWIYGPYVNHAYYAGLMELLVPFPIVLTISRRMARTSRAFFLFASVIMASTIFLSESLGGMIAFSIEVAILLLFLFHHRSFAGREVFLLGFLCLALIVWLVWLHPAGLVDRIARLLNPIQDAGATGRVAIVKDSMRMVYQKPILGWGLGTFSVVYPSFRSFFTNFWVNEAHNDVVQVLVETGILGLVFAGVFFLLLCREGFYRLNNWRVDTRSGVRMAAFLGCVGLTAHGLVDFNMHIPANAAFYFAMSAIAATNFSRFRSHHEYGQTRS